MIDLKFLFNLITLSLTLNLIVQPPGSSSVRVQGLSFKDSKKNLFQSDSIASLSNQFMKNLNQQFPSTQTVLVFEDCGQPGDAITIESFEVDPNPPKPGHKVTIRASGTAHELIEEGAYADVTVKLGSYIKLLQKRFDICEELSKANVTLQCPIQPGYYEIEQEIELPKEIPRAKYNVAARAYTQDDEDMACANVVLDFLKSWTKWLHLLFLLCQICGNNRNVTKPFSWSGTFQLGRIRTETYARSQRAILFSAVSLIEVIIYSSSRLSKSTPTL